MPIYSYYCQHCKKEKDIWKNINEDSSEICENCGNELVKTISLSHFHLKGEGWYKDGYSSKKE